MRTTEIISCLGSTIVTGYIPVISPFPFFTQARCQTDCCANPSDSARQWLAGEAVSVNSKLRAQYHLHPKFLQSP